MDPVCFHLGARPIYWYGVAMAAAYLAAVTAWSILGRRQGRNYAYASDLGFWLLLSGILGARVAYVVANWSMFRADPWTIVRIDQGGLIYYGGFLAAVAAAVVFAAVHRERLMAFADFAITSLPLGQAVGRVGCFLNSCCYGTPSDLPWAVWAEGCRRHPAQLYETALDLAIYAALCVMYRRRHREGRVFAAYLILYPAVRFGLEFFRGDPRTRCGDLNVAQWLSIALLAAGLVLWIAAPARAADRQAHADLDGKRTEHDRSG